jgi:hypothetical protein
MCFNGHKNWLLGWYDNRKIEVDRRSSGSWSGRLAAFVDYKSTSPSEYVLIKVGNLHLQYNRKKDFNSGTVEKADQVTVTEGVTSHNTSNSLAGLGFGGSYRYENFNGTYALLVQICGIYTDHIPNYVHVSIYIDLIQKPRCGEVPSASPSLQKPTSFGNSSNINTNDSPSVGPSNFAKTNAFFARSNTTYFDASNIDETDPFADIAETDRFTDVAETN